jgi:hypothetical protein
MKKLCGAELPLCRRASARHGAGEGEGCGVFGETSFNWVPFNVSFDAASFFVISDQMVIAFVLPERSTVQAEDPRSRPPGKAFQRTEPIGYFHVRRDQHVDVVGHDHEGVEIVSIESALAIENGCDNQSGDVGFLQVTRTAFGSVQQAVHRDKDFAGGHSCRWKDSICRQASMEAECYEDSFADYVPVGQSSLVKAHKGSSALDGDFSQVRPRRAEARRQGGSPPPPGAGGKKRGA